MIIKAYYTQDYFSHYDNDYNNTFTIPNTSKPITWKALNNPRIKWIDNDRVEMVINNYYTGTGNINFRTISRIKLIKQYSDNSTERDIYIYFVKNVNRVLDGGYIIELELDYWLTYFDLSPFGNVGSFLLGAPDQLIIDRSHLMPEPSSWLLSQDASYEFISDWPQYNALLSTLERVPFDISNNVDKVIYHNQNFLMCAPAYNDTCGATSVWYPNTNVSNSVQQYTTVGLQFAMPFGGITNYRYNLTINLVYINTPIEPNIYGNVYNIPANEIPQLTRDLKDNFNKTTLFLVIPYNSGATPVGRGVSDNTIIYPNLEQNTNRLNGFLLVPAPVDSKAYSLYISGKLNGVSSFLIDMPMPNVLGLINNNWNTASGSINQNTNLGLGLAVIEDYMVNNVRYKNYLLGFTIASPDLTINANYLLDGVPTTRDTNFKMLDNRYNRRPSYCTWRDFLVGYTTNRNTTDLYLLKGLNNFYFNFKSGFLQYNFQDYEWHRNNGWNYLEFRINLFAWSFAVQTTGFVKLLNWGDNGSTWFNNATTPWFYSNATRTSNYQQWIAPLKFSNAYYEFMNTQNNSFNTSLKQMRWNHLTNLIAPSFSTAVGAGGAAYSGLTGTFGKLGFLGAGAMAITGGLNLGKTLVNNYFDVEKKNSFLADLNATHNGFTNAVGNYNIDVLPSMLQVVINDYAACKLWNWINKYGYTVIDTFNARHINLNNLKTNKVVLNGVVSDNQKTNDVMKYGCIRFSSDNLAVINKAMRGSKVATNFEVLPTNAINWMSGLYIHGISFCAFMKS